MYIRRNGIVEVMYGDCRTLGRKEKEKYQIRRWIQRENCNEEKYGEIAGGREFSYFFFRAKARGNAA